MKDTSKDLILVGNQGSYISRGDKRINNGWYLFCINIVEPSIKELVEEKLEPGDYLIMTEKVKKDIYNLFYFDTKHWIGTGMIVLTEAGPLEILKKL